MTTNRNLNNSPQYDRICSYQDVSPTLNQIAEVVVLGPAEFIVARTSRGICFAYNRLSGETLILNKNKREQIKSTFLNQVNCSIFIVSVKSKNFVSKMQCRSVSLEDLRAGNTKGQKLFRGLTL